MMLNRCPHLLVLTVVLMLSRFNLSVAQESSPTRVFNVRDFGASGSKEQNARDAIQKAVDKCAAAGGGTVLFPNGAYSSGTIHLRSHVRLYLEPGATIYSIKDKNAFDREGLIFADGAENITVEGRGTIDGQGAYEWRLNDMQDDYIRPNLEKARAAGKALMRSFPKTNQYGKLFLLLRCKDVRIAGINLINSPSWTIHPYACERLVIDGVYIHTSLKDGVWADGIDPDGCKDVRISNCTIETGDDAIVFYSMNWFGPALPCENITVSNCRLNSSSSAIKFCDGIMNSVRHVTIDNCVITGANRGIAFMDFDGGEVSDVVLSNLTIECVRHDWFWWGDADPIHFNVRRRSEITPSVNKETEPRPGKIKRVIVSNVIARGQGPSICRGHPENWLEDVTIENFRLYLTADPNAQYELGGPALAFRWVKNLRLKDVEIHWDEPSSPSWTTALELEDIQGLNVSQFCGQSAPRGAAAKGGAITLSRIENAIIRDSRAMAGTEKFIEIKGTDNRDILLIGNDARQAQKLWVSDGTDVSKNVREEGNVLRADK